MEQNEITELVNKLVTKDNKFIVRSITVNLIPGSLGNPNIRVGSLPFYEWSKKKEMTYVITAGRYLDCRMLTDKAYLNDKDYFVTTSLKKAQDKVREIIERYIENIKK